MRPLEARGLRSGIEARAPAAWIMRRADQVSLRMSGLLAGPGVWSTRVAFDVARDEFDRVRHGTRRG